MRQATSCEIDLWYKEKKMIRLFVTLVVLVLSNRSLLRAQTFVSFQGFDMPRPSSYPQQIITGPDGALWFVEGIGGKPFGIGRITTKGEISEYPLPSDSQPSSITVGPDGALWFTDYRANRVGRITTAGAISWFTVPKAYSNYDQSGIDSIITGPDNALWFVENLIARIGRITTNGVLKEFSTTSYAFHMPTHMALGPDGAFWFTTNTGTTDRMTLIGAVTQYSTCAEYCWGLAASPLNILAGGSIISGSDGALWYTLPNFSAIGRMTTSGVASIYRTDLADGKPTYPTNITNGPDNTIWFTEGNNLVRMEPLYVCANCSQQAGRFTKYPIPNSQPGVGLNWLTLGPDGAVWITEPFANKIWKASLITPVLRNAASNLPGPISPGELVTITGAGLGPAKLVQCQPTSDGYYSVQCGGSWYVFGRLLSAPILYTSDSQAAAEVPYNLSLGDITINATYLKTSNVFNSSVVASAPGVFTLDSTGKGQAAAINQNGTVNKSSAPAKIGSVISLYATGEGQTTFTGFAGKIATAPPYPTPLLPVKVSIGGQNAKVLYAGGAPGMISGVMQVNVEIPSGISLGNEVPVVLQVGDAFSQPGVTIAVGSN